MVTNEDVERFIDQIPPAPAILKQTLAFVQSGELTKAAKAAEGDPALRSYLRTLVNRPIYGFRSEVNDISQIFGILGTSGAQQVLYNYMLSLLNPSSWELFELNTALFYELQASLSQKWRKILAHENIDDKDIESAVTLLPASIIVCEALFKESKEDIALLRSTKALDYNTILKRLCGKSLFDLCDVIATTWEMPQSVIGIVEAASGIHPSQDKTIDRLGQWMHLLLFFELSQGPYIQAGLNDFIDFQVEYVNGIYEEFMQVMGIE